ncbi:MAG TPA: HAD family hydrolase [Fimbriiglobus sp.]|nr:HAD family hydrolase [Fimbriiglobus sp.]
MSDPLIPADTRAVFFDAVGTVLHPTPGAPVVYAEAAARYGLPADPAAILERFRAAFRREEEADERSDWVTSEGREVARWRTIVRETLPGAPDVCFELLYNHFARPDAWRVPEEAVALFDHLAGRGLRLGLASNYDSRLESVLAGRPELAPLDGMVVISSRVGVRKPGAEFFARLTELSGCSHSEIVLVGDDYKTGFLGATAAGMRAVLLDPKGRHPDMSERVAALGDLLRSS